MMMRFTQTFIALSLLLAPVTAAAQGYMSPEQVLQSEDSAFLVPSRGPRGAQWAAQLERDLNAERHPSTLKEPWDASLNQAVPPPTQGELIPTESTTHAPSANDGYGQTVVDPVTARILARLLANESFKDSGYRPSTAGYKDAPLTGSGPASVIAALSLIPACIWTMRRARRLEKFMI